MVFSQKNDVILVVGEFGRDLVAIWSLFGKLVIQINFEIMKCATATGPF
jgi:hypothetical protein